jgi:hypothetical protein
MWRMPGIQFLAISVEELRTLSSWTIENIPITHVMATTGTNATSNLFVILRWWNHCMDVSGRLAETNIMYLPYVNYLRPTVSVCLKLRHNNKK